VIEPPIVEVTEAVTVEVAADVRAVEVVLDAIAVVAMAAVEDPVVEAVDARTLSV